MKVSKTDWKRVHALKHKKIKGSTKRPGADAPYVIGGIVHHDLQLEIRSFLPGDESAICEIR